MRGLHPNDRKTKDRGLYTYVHNYVSQKRILRSELDTYLSNGYVSAKLAQSKIKVRVINCINKCKELNLEINEENFNSVRNQGDIRFIEYTKTKEAFPSFFN
ncbi:hypothetical protein MA9V2_135 [Chryseobacterium phage MA9V-2]|nr:hypothetical protein MA9V2_135 [Chryseobacterium phage MA9V-2]